MMAKTKKCSRPLTTAFLAIAVMLFSAASSLAAFSIGNRVQAIGGYGIRQAAAGAPTGYVTVNGTLGTVLAGPTPAALSGVWYEWYGVSWDNGTIGWSVEASMTLAPAPTAPSGLAASVTATLVSLAWYDNSNNETGFKIERKTGSGGSWSQIGTTGQSIAAYIDYNVTTGVTYYYRVRAYNSSGNSQYSGEVSATPQVPLPAAPGYLEAQAFSARVELGWTDNSNNETGFKIERRTGSGSWSQIGTRGANSGSTAYYTDSTVAARSTYSYRVRAYNSAGDSGYGPVVTLTTPGGKPGAFTLSNDPPVWDAAIPGPKVRLNWTVSADVGNYAVYRNGTVYVNGIDGTTYLNSANLTAGATYTYFIRASNADGTTDSNQITVGPMPSAPVTIPADPGYLEAQAFSTRVELGWTDNSNNETGFKIERRTGSGSWSQIGTRGANSGSAAYYTDNTVATHTTYSYRVRAYNSAGDSGYGPVVTLTTPGGKPGNFTLSNDAPVWDPAIPGPKVQLHWTASEDAGNYAVYRNGTVYHSGITGTNYLNIANLTAGSTYTYFIRASNADGTTDSNQITVIMPNSPPTGPTAPSGLAAVPTATLVSLAWYDNSNNETGFKIERKVGLAGSWSQIGTTGANIAAYSDRNVTAGTTYSYRVRAYNASGDSSYSGEQTVTVPQSGAQVTVTSPNGGGTVQAGTSLPISWTVSGNSAAVSSFRIAYTLDGGATWGVAHSYVSGSARSVNWITPASASSSQCSLTILAFNAAGDVLHGDSSDGFFSITPAVSQPDARPTCDNNAPLQNEEVVFYGTSSRASSGTPQPTIVSYEWNFGDGSTANGSTVRHTYGTIGLRTVTLKVTDSVGLHDTSSLSVSVTGQALGEAKDSSKYADPVNLATGNFIYDHSDLTIPGIGFPFEFKRFYNSKDTTSTGVPVGFGWTHSYNLSLAPSNGTITVVFGDGHRESYTNSAGAYLAEAGIYNTLSTNANGTFSLTTKEQMRYNFNLQGRLASIVDKNSNTLSLTYSGAGALTAVTNSAGRAVTFVNDANNRIVRIVDPLSRTNSYVYSAGGDLVSATDPRGGVTRYGYDAEHQMTNAVDPNGNAFVRNVYSMKRVVESQKDALGYTTTFTYDFVTRETIVTNALGFRQVHKHDDKLRVIQIMDEAGEFQNFEYDEFNNRTKVVDKNRRTTLYTYDAKGNVTSKSEPPEAGQLVGYTTTIAYDPLNNPTNRVDARLGRSVFNFDGRGNLIKTVNAQNFTNTVTYTTKGLPLLIRDANGNTVSNAFDTAGNLLSTRDALGYTRTYSYDAVGRKLAEVDPNNATNRFTYDGNNNLLRSVDALGYTNVFAYDANNNQVLIQDALGNQTIKSYDPKDRLVSVRNALGGVTSNAYDALDRRISTTDPRGSITRFAYDPVGNLEYVTNSLGQVTRYTYDPNGNQLTVRNPLGQVTSNAYDVLNRLVDVTDALGYTTHYAYDELGRRTQVTDAESQVTRFFYDTLGRLTNVIDAATGTVHFAYDKVGNRTAMTEPNGRTTTYTYDALNRLTRKQEPIGIYQYRYDGAGNRIGLTDARGHSITNTFDANRRLTAVKDPNGSQVTFAYDANGNRTRMTDALGTTTYAYDALNRMTNCTDSAGKTVAYAYDASGNRVSMTYPGSRIVNYTFDSLNRMTTVRDWLGGVTTNTYDLAGNLALVRSPNGTTARHTFDNAGRLTSLTNALPNASVIAAYTLTLDGVGNHLQSAQIDPIEPLIPTQTVSYAYDTDNRLTNATGTAFVYDANGNMTAKGADTFAYDYENRLTNAVVGGIAHQYQYDGVGNRLRATRGGVTTRYVLDVNGTLAHVLAEADAAGTITAYYVYGRGLVSRITAGGSASYYHYDVRGSTVAITDSAGNVTDRYAYDPFGVVANSTGSTANFFKYVGRYGVMDEGNGLAYIRARYYSPVLGRFVTKDPWTGKDGDSQSLNRFIYALQNPLRYVDVSGYAAREGSGESDLIGSSDTRHNVILGDRDVDEEFGEWEWYSAYGMTYRARRVKGNDDLTLWEKVKVIIRAPLTLVSMFVPGAEVLEVFVPNDPRYEVERPIPFQYQIDEKGRLRPFDSNNWDRGDVL